MTGCPSRSARPARLPRAPPRTRPRTPQTRRIAAGCAMPSSRLLPRTQLHRGDLPFEVEAITQPKGCIEAISRDRLPRRFYEAGRRRGAGQSAPVGTTAALLQVRGLHPKPHLRRPAQFRGTQAERHRVHGRELPV